MHARCARLVWLGPTPPKLAMVLEGYWARQLALWPTPHPEQPTRMAWSLRGLFSLTDVAMLSFERVLQQRSSTSPDTQQADRSVARDRKNLQYAFQLARQDLAAWTAEPNRQTYHEAAILAVARAMLLLDTVKAHETAIAKQQKAMRQ